MNTVAKDAEQELKQLSRWFDDGRAWVRHAANLLVAGEEPPIDDLVAIVKHEAGIGSPPTVDVRACNISPHLTRTDAPFDGLHLDRIENIQHVNVLKPKRPLTFGAEGLTVVYGDNGSGKSGYTRILKHACGARRPGSLYADVRDIHIDEPVPQATICYTVDDKETQLAWRKGLPPAPPLSSTEIYDSECGDVYANEDHVLIYEPPILQLFARLISLAGRVESALLTERASLTAKKITVPPEYLWTTVARWYQGLSENTSAGEIADRVSWTAADEKQFADLKERLASDPGSRARTLRTQQNKLQEAMRTLRALADSVSPEAVAAYRQLVGDAEEKRGLATNHAAALSRDLPLEISSPLWRRLWQFAREYSQNIAYVGKPFPHTEDGAHCLLCQQPLSSQAAARFHSFEEYIKGKLEGDALAAETTLSEQRQEISANCGDLFLDSLDSILMAGGYEQQDRRAPLLLLATLLLERARSLLGGTLAPERVGSAMDLSALESLRSAIVDLDERARGLDQDAESENRKVLVAACTDLEAKRWLSGFRAAIDLERESLVACHALGQALRHTTTRGLTEKKNELSEILISEAYISRFRLELAALRADKIEVEMVKGSPRKGVVPHEIRLKGAIQSPSTEEVLSEGERRVVSLAAFLADMTGHSVKAPVIFDDPISSLDQNFEEAVAKRLVRLAKERQVVVFTHRMSLAWLLGDLCKKESIEAQFHGVERTLDGCGNPEEPPFTSKKSKVRIKDLTAEISKARKAAALGKREYDEVALRICVSLRKTLENIVENDLLQGVVVRFRKSVQTDGRLGLLARLIPSDCRLIDGLMTKYSYDLHEQAAETPRALPSPDDIEADLLALAAWREEFDARPKAF